MNERIGLAEDNAVEGRPAALATGPRTEVWLGDNSVSNDLKTQWLDNGYVIIRGVYGAPEIERYNEIVAKTRKEYEKWKDENGFGDRIGQLHQKEPELLNLACNPAVLTFLRWALNDDPVVFASLNFEKGTQQEAHSDAIFFWPEPSYSMAGCWVALEDVHPDAGPLFYVPQSHKWPFYRSEDVVLRRPDLAFKRRVARDPGVSADVRAATVGELGNAWTECLLESERRYETKRVPIPLQAGDVLCWHSLLAHGGSPRLNPAMSRRSVVFHYIGKSTKLYTFEQFMLYNKEEIPEQTPQEKNLRTFKQTLEYMRYPYFVTYGDGQISHPLTD